MLDLSVDGGKATPVVLKEAQRDPVRGETIHVDLLRVRLDEEIHAVVPLELLGVDDAPGVKEGGVLEQITRELNVAGAADRDPRVDRPRGRRDADRRHDHALRDRRARGRDAARRPRGDRRGDALAAELQAEVEEEIEAETELVGEGEEEGEAAAADEGAEESSSDSEE